MIYYNSREETYLQVIKTLFKEIDADGLKPEYALFRLLRSDFSQWSKLLDVREQLLLEAE